MNPKKRIFEELEIGKMVAQFEKPFTPRLSPYTLLCTAELRRALNLAFQISLKARYLSYFKISIK